jgi:cytochrome c oxidase subunit II
MQIKLKMALIILVGCSLFSPSANAEQESGRTIEVHVHRFAFVPTEITIKKAETVKLRLVSDDVAHSLSIPGLKINQEVTKSHPADITLKPSATGDFQGKCGRFCGKGHGSMQFTVHVEN